MVRSDAFGSVSGRTWGAGVVFTSLATLLKKPTTSVQVTRTLMSLPTSAGLSV